VVQRLVGDERGPGRIGIGTQADAGCAQLVGEGVGRHHPPAQQLGRGATDTMITRRSFGSGGHVRSLAPTYGTMIAMTTIFGFVVSNGGLRPNRVPRRSVRSVFDSTANAAVVVIAVTDGRTPHLDSSSSPC
jgi:hypothetical protein